MPISSVSTIFIQIPAPVLENAANIKNTGKYYFAGVLANNRKSILFYRRFSSDYSDSPKISSCINRASTVNTRVRITCYIFFGKHTIYTISPIPVNLIYSTIHIIPTILSHIHYNYIDITILLSYCNYIVTVQYIAIYIDTIYR